MLRTILLGTKVSVQGILVKTLGDGRLVVRDGDKVYTGMAVSA